MANALQAVAENSGALAAMLSKGEAGKSMGRSWSQLLEELEAGAAPHEDSRSPEEVVEDIKRKVKAISLA